MKLNLFLISALFVAFMSCKDGGSHTHNPETEAAHEHHDAHEHEADGHDEHGHEAGTELALNNGAKWTSDDLTNMHAQKMVEFTEEFKSKAGDANLEMFRNYADILQQELNGMIKDCTMKGPDHDALHLWLEPVLEGVKELKGAENEEDARKMETGLSEKILKYNQFFN